MESNTFRTRLSQLTQKTRKALRLYSGSLSSARTSSRGFSNSSATPSGDYSNMQVAEWQEVTRDLLESIAPLVALSNTRKMTAQFYSVRDRFYNEWRLIQADLHKSQQELEVAGRESDFIRCAKLSLSLVTLKARMQACQAAHNELQQVLKQSKAVAPSASAQAELTEEKVAVAIETDTDQELEGTNVIPLLRKRNY